MQEDFRPPGLRVLLNETKQSCSRADWKPCAYQGTSRKDVSTHWCRRLFLLHQTLCMLPAWVSLQLDVSTSFL